jgi:hypothetical protein
LNDLAEKQYINPIKPKAFTDHSKPTIYYLATNGIRFIKRHTNQTPQSLQKLYREHERSDAFIRRCLLLADMYLNLRDQTTETTKYAMYVPGQYPVAALSQELVSLTPHGYVIRKQGDMIDQYFLETFDDVPLSALRQQLKRYVTFFDTEGWLLPTTMPYPTTLLLICMTPKVVNTVTRLAKKLSKNHVGTQLSLMLTTVEKIKEGGMTADIWHTIA